MNELVELLDELQKKAKADPILREKLLQTRENPNPIHAFCEICHAYGVSIYEMDLARNQTQHQWRRRKFPGA